MAFFFFNENSHFYVALLKMISSHQLLICSNDGCCLPFWLTVIFFVYCKIGEICASCIGVLAATITTCIPEAASVALLVLCIQEVIGTGQSFSITKNLVSYCSKVFFIIDVMQMLNISIKFFIIKAFMYVLKKNYKDATKNRVKICWLYWYYNFCNSLEINVIKIL